MTTAPSKHVERLIQTIRSSVIGDDEALDGPFGLRRITYADYTASGRSLAFIEDYIRREVLTKYANTHTEISGTGLQTTTFREEARSIIRASVGAEDGDAVVFCGSGATAAVHKLIAILNLRLPADLDVQFDLSSAISDEARPVVFIGPYEHHSNELSWKETIADVVVIQEDQDGGVDLEHLRQELSDFADRPLLIGSFSAASNVTGILTDIDAVTRLLHAHGALSFWDFAAAGPYVDIAMNAPGAEKDAVFISPHKFVGGPGSPGLLIVKKSLCTNRIPSEPGGGTVTWVSPSEHQYADSVEQREEGGTPEIIGSIRAGLAFQLKEAVGVTEIRKREHAFVRRAVERWNENPNLVILGDTQRERISIVSLMIRHHGRYLHWSYVVALLNDLFGIQARGGCSCAGPYGHKLMGMDLLTSEAFERLTLSGWEGAKPGWVRLNFNYFIGDDAFDFLLSAIDFVATHGWRLLPCYGFEPDTGRWRHREGYPDPPMRLTAISYAQGTMDYASHHAAIPPSALPGYLTEAEKLAESAAVTWSDREIPASELPPDFEQLRWFVLPEEALAELKGGAKPDGGPSILRPRKSGRG